MGVSPSPSFGPSPLAQLLWPLLTSRAERLAASSPFQAQSEISPGKNIGLRCAIAGSTSPRLGHNGFAIIGSLALFGSASYPVPVRRLATPFPASFTPSSRSDALRFPALAVTSSREDFHLQISAHAGRTNKKGAVTAAPFSTGLSNGLVEEPVGLHVQARWAARCRSW